MSFILDALKKSEAERQLGEVPSLQSAGEITAVKDSRRPWYLALLILLLVFVVAGWFWQKYTGNEAGEASIITKVEKSPKPAGSSKPEYRSAAKLPRITKNKTPVGDYTPPADVKTFSDGMDLPDTGKIISITQDMPTAGTPGVAQSDDPAVAAASGKDKNQQRLDRLKKQRKAEHDEDAALVAAVDRRLAEEKARQTKKNKAAVKKKKANSVRLYELPVSVRSSLPEINISMQVYSTDPESRFAIVNGKRYMESDQIAESVVLDEILRQGIILKFRQYRILID